MSNTIASIFRIVMVSHLWKTGLRVVRKGGIVPCFPLSSLALGTLSNWNWSGLVSSNSKTLPMAEAAALHPW